MSRVSEGTRSSNTKVSDVRRIRVAKDIVRCRHVILYTLFDIEPSNGLLK